MKWWRDTVAFCTWLLVRALLPTRPAHVVQQIVERYGSPERAAMSYAINAEEYLRASGAK